MKTIRSGLVPAALICLTVGIAPAQAHHRGHGRDAGPVDSSPSTATAIVHGVVVSADQATGTIVVALAAQRAHPSGHGCSGHGPGTPPGDGSGPATATRRARGADTAGSAPAPVTVSTDAGTLLTLDGRTATVADFVAGTRIVVKLNAAGAASTADALAKPALAIAGMTAPPSVLTDGSPRFPHVANRAHSRHARGHVRRHR
jgi:hypothetical protein